MCLIGKGVGERRQSVDTDRLNNECAAIIANITHSKARKKQLGAAGRQAGRHESGYLDSDIHNNKKGSFVGLHLEEGRPEVVDENNLNEIIFGDFFALFCFKF